MTGETATPGAVQSAIFDNPFLAGPLGWMISTSATAKPQESTIRAIWRNEIGKAEQSGT